MLENYRVNAVACKQAVFLLVKGNFVQALQKAKQQQNLVIVNAGVSQLLQSVSSTLLCMS